ncbi:hypothetical protein PPTG_23279 [Phytophthora nicotianae INRA-310]|uniref:Uncharacterized protein n=4 Tax=Phytophthora nicotianae TaxID=4792 RepID=W2Q0Z2_PHYN3|nr:hypothetical protein PPTG_23279 [Phytophthora nicotianae INRA-310]ETI43352.1 hypothetical protein F443_11671 [Phytophthora nicotianae P1569]ETM43305.1 hypothetical protein L914_11192 [Phytophthora nicotianae]ETN06853.1 hypothetical protein PPTG_23279 [Phytophthora nicotianae INRA-310]ETO72028.1 hypothetical protein F444_11744 [Phytophthora nicotianae P1976]
MQPQVVQVGPNLWVEIGVYSACTTGVKVVASVNMYTH